jgi:hypothetical protein
MSYHAFKDDEGQPFGSFEVFQVAANDRSEMEKVAGLYIHGTVIAGTEPGFYWQACFPGCLPDGEPSGPFETEAEAIEDAQGQG